MRFLIFCGCYPRKSGRAVEGTGLENQQQETVRGFESHLFRQVWLCCSCKELQGMGATSSYNNFLAKKQMVMFSLSSVYCPGFVFVAPNGVAGLCGVLLQFFIVSRRILGYRQI